jgi:hypothetical protein
MFCRGQEEMLYPGLILVESVSWMLLSVGAKLEPRSGLEGEGYLLWSQIGALRIYWSWLCKSKWVTSRGENSGGWSYTLSECSAVLAARRLVEQSLNFWLAVAWKHTKIVENLGVITTPKFSYFWTLERAWSYLGTVPSHKCTLSRAQSRLHWLVIT